MAQIETNSAPTSKVRLEERPLLESRRPPTQISTVDRRTDEDVVAIQRLASLIERL